jgi:hypothetical protein
MKHVCFPIFYTVDLASLELILVTTFDTSGIRPWFLSKSHRCSACLPVTIEAAAHKLTPISLGSSHQLCLKISKIRHRKTRSFSVYHSPVVLHLRTNASRFSAIRSLVSKESRCSYSLRLFHPPFCECLLQQFLYFLLPARLLSPPLLILNGNRGTYIS